MTSMYALTQYNINNSNTYISMINLEAMLHAAQEASVQQQQHQFNSMQFPDNNN